PGVFLTFDRQLNTPCWYYPRQKHEAEGNEACVSIPELPPHQEEVANPEKYNRAEESIEKPSPAAFFQGTNPQKDQFDEINQRKDCGSDQHPRRGNSELPENKQPESAQPPEQGRGRLATPAASHGRDVSRPLAGIAERHAECICSRGRLAATESRSLAQHRWV